MTRPALATPRIVREDRSDGSVVLRSTEPLGPFEDSLVGPLRRWARERGDQTFLAERQGEAWRELTWSDALETVRRVGQGLLDRGLGPDRPVAVLCGNGIDHALVSMAAQYVGVPVAPISAAYSAGGGGARLRQALELVQPGLVFDGAPGALDALGATPPTAAVDAAADATGPDTIAKILLTSGSTGVPKGVVNTNRMLWSNQQALAQVWPFTTSTPPVLVDWLPWSHTFGGNHNFNLVVRSGGTLYVDGGRPAPGAFDATLQNLREISPTVQFNVPAGFALLVHHLERDEALRRRFFARLQLVFYAGAALPQDVWDRLQAQAVRTRGEPVVMTTAWGSTETAPMVTSAHFPTRTASNIGVPVPGCELKLVPNGSKLELRVRGPNVTPGYLRAPELTAAAFDEDGFYCIGDAGQLVDPEDPSAGIRFDGRVAEDFKLTTGTWVSVGPLRTDLLAATDGLLSAAVVVGADRDEVGLLAWVHPGAAAELAGDVADEVGRRIAAHNARETGSSRRCLRVALLSEPPDPEAGEITDKGYVNAAAVQARRAAVVQALYAAPAGDPVVLRA